MQELRSNPVLVRSPECSNKHYAHEELSSELPVTSKHGWSNQQYAMQELRSNPVLVRSPECSNQHSAHEELWSNQLIIHPNAENQTGMKAQTLTFRAKYDLIASLADHFLNLWVCYTRFLRDGNESASNDEYDCL